MKRLNAVDLETLEKDSKNTYNRTRLLDIKKGLNYLVRFLPIDAGNGKFYVKHSLYWVSNKPITSIPNTDECIGGDTTFKCPVDSAIHSLKKRDNLNSAQEKFLDEIGPKVNFYIPCVLVDVIDKKQNSVLDFSYEPYFLRVSASTLSDLKLLMVSKRSSEKEGGLSILDYVNGHNVWVSKKESNGYIIFQKENREPILSSCPEVNNSGLTTDEIINEIENLYKKYSTSVPSREDLEETADQIDEIFEDLESRGRNRGRNRGNYDDDNVPSRRSRTSDDDDSDVPSRRSRDQYSDVTSRRSRTSDDDDSDVTSRRSRTSEDDSDVPPRRSRDQDSGVTSRRSRTSEDDSDVPPRRSRDQDSDVTSRRSNESGRIRYEDGSDEDDSNTRRGLIGDDVPMNFNKGKSPIQKHNDDIDDELVEESGDTDPIKVAQNDDDIGDELESKTTTTRIEDKGRQSSLKSKLKSYANQ